MNIIEQEMWDYLVELLYLHYGAPAAGIVAGLKTLIHNQPDDLNNIINCWLCDLLQDAGPLEGV